MWTNDQSQYEKHERSWIEWLYCQSKSVVLLIITQTYFENCFSMGMGQLGEKSRLNIPVRKTPVINLKACFIQRVCKRPFEIWNMCGLASVEGQFKFFFSKEICLPTHDKAFGNIYSTNTPLHKTTCFTRVMQSARFPFVHKTIHLTQSNPKCQFSNAMYKTSTNRLPEKFCTSLQIKPIIIFVKAVFETSCEANLFFGPWRPNIFEKNF